MWVYLNPKIWHRLNEQVIQREFEVSTRHRRVNKTQCWFSFKPKGWIDFIHSAFLQHFGARELLSNVNSYYGEERRHWQPDCHTHTVLVEGASLCSPVWSAGHGSLAPVLGKLWKLEGCWSSPSSSLSAGVPRQPVILRAGCVCAFYLSMRGNIVWL